MKNIIRNIIAIVLVVVVMCFSPTITCASDNENNATDRVVPVAATAATETTKSGTETTTKKAAFKPYNLYVKVNKAKVRKKPNKKAKVAKSYYKGKKVKVIGKSGDWRKIGKGLWIHKSNLAKKNPMKTYKGVRLKYYAKYNITSNKLTRGKGVVHYNGHKETWYSSKEYGQTQTAYHIPGKHLAKDGTYRDKDGYICIAANYLGKGSVIMTSLGPGKVYDRGGMRGHWIDIYTNW